MLKDTILEAVFFSVSKNVLWSEQPSNWSIFVSIYLMSKDKKHEVSHCSDQGDWPSSRCLKTFRNSLMIGTNVNCHDTRLGLQRKHGTNKVQCLLTLCMLSNFTCFFSVGWWFFLKSTFSKNSFRNIIRVSNSLEPDQARHRAWSGSILFAKVISRRH